MTTKIFSAAVISEVAPATTKYVSEFGVMCEYNNVEDVALGNACVLRIRDVMSGAILIDFINADSYALIDGTLNIGLPENDIVFGSGSLISPGRYPIRHRYKNRIIEFQTYIYGISIDDIGGRINELSVLDELARVQSASHSEPQLVLEYKWYGLTELTRFDITAVSVALPDGYIGMENITHDSSYIHSVTVTLETRPFAYGEWQAIMREPVEIAAWSDGIDAAFVNIHSSIIGGDSPCPMRIALINQGDDIGGVTISSHIGKSGVPGYRHYLASTLQNGSDLWAAYIVADTNEHPINKAMTGEFARYYYQVPYWNLDPNGIPMDNPSMWDVMGWFRVSTDMHFTGSYIVYARMRDSSSGIPSNSDEVFRLRLRGSVDRTIQHSIDCGSTVVFGFTEESQSQIGPTFQMVRLGDISFPLQSKTSTKSSDIWLCIEAAVFSQDYMLPEFRLDIDYLLFVPTDNGSLFLDGINDFSNGKTLQIYSDIQSIQLNNNAVIEMESSAISGMVAGQFPMLIPGIDNTLHFTSKLSYYGGAHAANSSILVNIGYRPTYLFIASQSPYIP